MKIFVGRIKNTTDRDACFYIENDHRDICGHLIFSGACYSGYYDEIKQNIENDNVNSFLTREELLEFLDKKDKFQYYIDKLTSYNGVEFKNKIMKEEQEILKKEYNLTDNDIIDILDDYCQDYEDRAIVCGIYENAEQLASEIVCHCYDVDSAVMPYINFEDMGEDILNNDTYLRLSDGRIICYSY